MNIQEWFARAVAAGLMPDSLKNVYAKYMCYNNDSWFWVIYNAEFDGLIPIEYMKIEIKNLSGLDKDGSGDQRTIQLRKDGKDLYSLEWRKPTESDVGKMCWISEPDGVLMLAEISGIGLWAITVLNKKGKPYTVQNVLLANHPFPPTEQDFKRIYESE